MIPEISINHRKVFRANGNVYPVGPEYPGNIGVAIRSFCEAGSTFPFVGQR